MIAKVCIKSNYNNIWLLCIIAIAFKSELKKIIQNTGKTHVFTIHRRTEPQTIKMEHSLQSTNVTSN